MMEALTNTLREIGKPTEIYQTPDGSTALVLPYGGRILGLFAPDSPENFYWTHPALASVGSARAFYENGQWHNSGGDRAWLAPEVDFFFPDFPNTDTYRQPRELDPGRYKVVKSNGGLALVNDLTLTLSRSRRNVQLQVTRSLAPAPNPLRHERNLKDLEQVDYAGCALHSRLELVDTNEACAPPVGLWSLVQLPHGGELLAPTYSRAEPKVCFGTIAPEDLTVEERMVRYRMRAMGAQKIAIRAVAATGRIGYMYPAGDRCALVVRNLFVDPSGEYVDVPWDDTEDLGYAIQACSIDNNLGAFSELEYHVPAIGGETGRTSCEDTSQIWAFRGSAEKIQKIANALLSAEAAC